MTYIAIIGFTAILGSLVAAMVFMLKGGEKNKQDNIVKKSTSKRMARALAFRVGFSVLLFMCVLIAWRFGYIQPTGIAPGR